MNSFPRGALLLLLLSPLSLFAQERLFVPLAVGGPGLEGGYGSIWKSELHAFNRGTSTITVRTSASLCMLGSCPTSRFTVPPGGSVEIFSGEPTILRVIGGTAGDLSFNARVFDDSRNRVDWGTEIPVIDLAGASPGFALLNVPVRAGFRVLLRLYEAEGGSDTEVTIRMRDAVTNAIVSETTANLQARLYGPVYDFGSTQVSLDEPLGAGVEGRVHLEIAPVVPSRRIWGFVSVTHNETQHVTLISPQPM
jgi:hypothetical protein